MHALILLKNPNNFIIILRLSFSIAFSAIAFWQFNASAVITQSFNSSMYMSWGIAAISLLLLEVSASQGGIQVSASSAARLSVKGRDLAFSGISSNLEKFHNAALPCPNVKTFFWKTLQPSKEATLPFTFARDGYIIFKKGDIILNCKQNPRKCAIIGCGFVGAASAFALMMSKLFSELVLIDANYDKADGEAKDISHGIPFAGQMRIYAGDYHDLSDASLVIVTAGANQKPGETRIDLVHKNVDIFKSVIPQIVDHGFNGVLLIVANPVDILTYAAAKISGFPEKRVIGSGTVLDTARLRYALGQHLGVDSRSVHAFVIGEHGDSEIVAWSCAYIAGVPLRDFCAMRGYSHPDEELARIADEVKHSAYEIIAKKQATYYGIAMSVKRICECIARDEKSILPISTIMSGEYGIWNISLSIPAIVGSEGIEAHVPIFLDEREASDLRYSADTLKEVASTLNL